jgi:hypothetical protein
MSYDFCYVYSDSISELLVKIEIMIIIIVNNEYDVTSH